MHDHPQMPTPPAVQSPAGSVDVARQSMTAEGVIVAVDGAPTQTQEITLPREDAANVKPGKSVPAFVPPPASASFVPGSSA
ncbi:hypothetical protein HA397_28750, partial [Escherichia coli]|nr:hypothetical protein [Escherichia coli]